MDLSDPAFVRQQVSAVLTSWDPMEFVSKGKVKSYDPVIAEIIAGLPTAPNVLVGPGDDCAVFAPDGAVAVSTDTMVTGRHWRPNWSGPRDVGRKAVASATADLEAIYAAHETPDGVAVAGAWWLVSARLG